MDWSAPKNLSAIVEGTIHPTLGLMMFWYIFWYIFLCDFFINQGQFSSYIVFIGSFQDSHIFLLFVNYLN